MTKNAQAVALANMRKTKLTKARRSAIASHAATERWRIYRLNKQSTLSTGKHLRGLHKPAKGV